MANGDILACRIASTAAHNGWVAEIDISSLAGVAPNVGGSYAFGLGANNDPSTAKIIFTLTSLGYDNTGAATTIQRTIYGTQWMRKASPNEATANETSDAIGNLVTVRVALSDFVYSSDASMTVTMASGVYTQGGIGSAAATALAVTNGSTLAYPKVVGRWAWPAFETVQSNFLLEAVCFHRSAKDAKPVAAVVFTVADAHSNSQSVTATAMTVSTRTGDANTVLVYAATIPISSFTQGDVLTCNFVAYPWVGDSGATLDSNSGITPPDERLCPHLLVCDKNSTYGGAFAVIDVTNGQASALSTWVTATQAAAEAAYVSATTNSYQTITHALQALKAYNNTNYSRNNPGGGTCLLTGTHATVTVADLGAMDTWAMVTRLSTKTRAQVNVNGGVNQILGTRKLKYYDITIDGSQTGQIRGSITTSVIWVHSCAIAASATSAIYTWQLAYATQNTVDALFTMGFTHFSTTKCPWALVRGNTGPTSAAAAGVFAHAYCLIGNRNLHANFIHTGNNAATQQVADNAIVAFNTHFGFNDSSSWLKTGSAAANIVGLAVVQNVLEQVINSVLMQIHADNVSGTSDHVLVWHNTLAGARLNIAYNETGSTPYLHKNYSQRGNLFDDRNNKDDTFGTPDAARTGAWPVGYNVGARGNHARITTFASEFEGLNTVAAGGTWAFVSDASFNNGGGGSAAGNGDYHPTASASGYTLVPSGQAVLPYDIAGTARSLTGGSAGAYEMVGAGGSRAPIIGGGYY